MTLYLKLIFACFFGCILALTVKKHSPEIAILISIAIVMSVAMTIMEAVSHLKTQFQSTDIFSYLPKEYFVPLLKCIAISVITQITCAICKDMGQAAVASGLEFAGSIVLVLCMMPLINVLFQLIGGII